MPFKPILRMGKVYHSWQDLSDRLSAVRANKRVVFTNGCFDILHVGHIRYLQEARALGDFLVIGINSDSSVRGLKGLGRPVQNEQERAEILAALGCVDFVALFSDETPLKLIEQVHPDILVKGGDWPVDKIVGSKFVLSYGGHVHSLQFVPGHSTTSLIEKITRL